MKWLGYFAGTVAAVIVLVVLTAIIFSALGVRSMLAGNVKTAEKEIQISLPITRLLSFITFQKSRTIGCWQSGQEAVVLVSDAQQLLAVAGKEYRDTGTIGMGSVQSLVGRGSQTAKELRVCLKESRLLALVLPERTRQRAQNLADRATTFTSALSPLFEDNQTWVVMFQNTTELRPTGGFTGSYALVELRDQQLQALTVEDIYDADGQVARFRDAPAGVQEYTSGNNGLRLPDANWWPDFPTSAQAQLDFLADGGKKNLTGLVAINLTLLQDILRITGPLPLPDYQSNLTPENAPLLLRSHAENFFPGSRGKKQLLSYAMAQLQYQLSTVNGVQRNALLNLFDEAVATKDIQIFSTKPEQQAALSKLGVTGAIVNDDNPMLGLVEANVGINKSNRFIQRSMALHHEGNQLIATLHLKNIADQLEPSQPASQTAYVDYQRVITTPDMPVNSITIAGKSPKTTTDVWTTASGRTLTQKGFIVAIAPGKTETITFTIQPNNHDTDFWFVHQSGSGPTPLTITNAAQESTSLTFDRDLLITP